jgi:hypothetical protein
MDVYSQIQKKLKEITDPNGKQSVVFPAEVVSISGNTCVVKVDNLELSDVRLKSVVDNETEQLLVTPEIGSFVLVVDLSNGEYRDLAVIKYSKVTEINIKTTTNDFEVAMAKGKISIKNNNYSLKEAFDDIIDALGRLTVTTGVGPSGIPINKAEFDAVKTQLNNLLA